MSNYSWSPAASTSMARSAAIVMAIALGVLWAVELVDQLLRGALDSFGIHAWRVESLPSIFVAPLLHDGWGHLIGNSIPFAILGFVVLLGGIARWLISTVLSVVGSGLFAWLLSPPNTLTIGASGLVFGWLTYLLSRGLFSRDGRQILIAVVVFLVYGGVLWGVLPSQAGVSWQGHLGGAIGGIVAAWLAHRRSPSGYRPQRP